MSLCISYRNCYEDNPKHGLKRRGNIARRPTNRLPQEKKDLRGFRNLGGLIPDCGRGLWEGCGECGGRKKTSEVLETSEV